jgi:hypothetical protein
MMAFLHFRITVAELVTAFARLKLLEMKQITNDQFQMNIKIQIQSSFRVMKRMTIIYQLLFLQPLANRT